MRAALAEHWNGGDVSRIMVTHGSSEAIYLVMYTVPDPGDEIIVVDPAYQQFYDIAAARGGRIAQWPLGARHGFAADLSPLRQFASSGPAQRGPHRRDAAAARRQRGGRSDGRDFQLGQVLRSDARRVIRT